MERKILPGAAFKRAEGCEFAAVIATLGGVVDSDGDVILPGAFAGAEGVPVLPAHDQQHVPIGKVRVIERGGEAIAEGRFNTAIEAGRDWCSALKFDLADPPALQEWSFGFLIPEGGASRERRDGRSVRVIRSLDVLEVSPVLRGAGVNTRTTCAGDSCRGKGAEACGCGGSCSRGDREAAWTAEAVRKFLAVCYPDSKHPERLHEDLAEMEAEDARREEAAAQEAIREALKIAASVEADTAARAEGQERVKWLPVPGWLDTLARDLASDLGILTPRVRLFRECRLPEKADDLLGAGVTGTAQPSDREVYIRDALGRWETLVTLGHELYHLWEHEKGREASEHDAEEYGREVADWYESQRVAV